MRASIDANVLISFLLNPTSMSAPARVTHAGIHSEYQLCLSEALIHEVSESVRHKPYLSSRIASGVLDHAIMILRLSAEIAPDAHEIPQQRVRDPKDDYLVAHAIHADVDYLVTGDKDLLVLEQVEGVKIITPAAFLDILDQTGH